MQIDGPRERESRENGQRDGPHEHELRENGLRDGPLVRCAVATVRFSN